MPASRLRPLLVALVLLSVCGPASAQPLPEDDVPEALRPWIDWALDSDRSHECAWLGSTRECA